MKTMTYILNLTLLVVCTQFVFAVDSENQDKVFINPAEEAAQVKADNYFLEKVIQTKLDELKANPTNTTRSTPDWEDCPGCYEFTATISGAVILNLSLIHI